MFCLLVVPLSLRRPALGLVEPGEGFDGGHGVEVEVFEGVDERIGRGLEELELEGWADDGGVRRNAGDLVALEGVEDLAGAVDDLGGKAGEAGDLAMIVTRRPPRSRSGKDSTRCRNSSRSSSWRLAAGLVEATWVF